MDLALVMLLVVCGVCLIGYAGLARGDGGASVSVSHERAEADSDGDGGGDGGD